MLLRERLGRRARVPARPVIDREPTNRLVLLVERYLPNRAGVALTVLMLLGSAGLGIVKGGHVDDIYGRGSAIPVMRWPIRPASASPPSPSTAASN